MKSISDVMLTFKPHHTRYDFSGAVYTGALKRITGIMCKTHGPFSQYAGQFQKEGGAGCPKCGDEVRRMSRRSSCNSLLEKLTSIHGDKYEFPDLTDVSEKPGTTAKMRVLCSLHGEFRSSYSNLLNRKGCPGCAKLTVGRYTKQYEVSPQSVVAKMRKERRLVTLVDSFRSVHGDKYDYSKMVYDGMRTKITIVCPDHLDFLQTPSHHINGKGCPNCSHRVSSQECDVTAYLRSLGVVVETQNRVLIAPAELDLYLPEFKIAIEFNGAHWHADDQNRRHTCSSKRKQCLAVGIRLISIFDFEWSNSQEAVKATLRAAVGKQERVGGREVTVRQIQPNEAREFLNKWHVAKFVGAKLYLGAFKGDELIGVATFGASRFKKGEFELLRYATSCHLVGGLKKMVSAAYKSLTFDTLTSYCDLRYGTGKSYENAGFIYQGDTPTDYWWFKGSKYYTRYAVQKHKLATNPDFSEFYSADKTEKQIMESAGFRKISGAGHSKWLFTPKQPSGV